MWHPAPGPSLEAVHSPAVQLDQLAHNRQAKPEPAVFARKAAVRLPESLEDMRQERRFDALPVIAHHDVDRRSPSVRGRSLHVACREAVNFTAFDSRFQTTCCSRSGSPDTGATSASIDHLKGDALGVGGRLHRWRRRSSESRRARPSARSSGACRT